MDDDQKGGGENVSGRKNLKAQSDTSLYCQNCALGDRRGNRLAEDMIELQILLKVATELLVSWKVVTSIPAGIIL